MSMLEAEDMTDTWLVLDANYLCHRARWAMKDLSWKGAPTGVIYGFLQTVLQLEERFQTDRIAFCFDSAVSKRQEIYPDYKANRKNRKPMTKEEQTFEKDFRREVMNLRNAYLPMIGFRNIYFQSGYESDDLIAAFCSLSIPMSCEAVIVTADEDLFQCITGKVSVFNPQKHVRMTLQKFWSQYGITPDQWPQVKAIAGCSSDNIPGVPGIGQKTALQYIKCTLKEDSATERKIIAEQRAKEPLETYYRLVKLPFEGVQTPQIEKDAVSPQGWDRVCKALGFRSLRNKLPRIHR